jgi:hypothetical protein
VLKAIIHSAAHNWAKVIDGAADERPDWTPGERRSILRHQLDAELEIDSSGGIRSLAELFSVPSPPLDLVRQTKDFAKRNYGQPESLLPQEVSLMLYFAGLATALVRCRERISQLGDDELRKGFEWALAQPWGDERLRPLFREAIGLSLGSPLETPSTLK